MYTTTLIALGTYLSIFFVRVDFAVAVRVDFADRKEAGNGRIGLNKEFLLRGW